MKMEQDYYGTKRVTAWPETRNEFFQTTETYKPEEKDGYGVKYEDGYTSWSPKDVFEKAYQPLDALSFGHALAAIKEGHRVCRQGWNGRGMFIFLVPGSVFKVNRKPLLGIYPEGTEINYHAHIDMKTADDMVVPWLASQTDMLADDWMIVE
jgi:hypothetical protein